MAVRGNLEHMSLSNIIQNICYDQRSASLTLRRQIEEGVIFFQEGEIIHAQLGSMEGEAAVYRLLNWTDGTFWINDEANAPSRTVTAPWNHLLMEGMRLIDEQEVEDTQDDKQLTPAQIRHDENLEGDILVLISSLEQMLDQLSHKKSLKNPTLALRSLTEMTNEVVTFSAVWLDTNVYANSLSRAVTKASDIYSSIQMLQVQDNEVLIDVILKLYRSWAKDQVGRRKMFNEIGLGIRDILETYFALLLACFHSSSMSQTSQEVIDIFLADLTQAMDKIKF